MARMASTMLDLGTPAPDFTLPNTNASVGAAHCSLGDFEGQPALLVVFMCNHCPYVVHIREALVAFAREYEPRGLAVVAISANDAERYPDDSPERMAQESAARGYPFPYLYDESQQTARAYRAACTPDFFLFDAERRLAYTGQFDASRPGNDVPVTGRDLRRAAERVLAGEPVPGEHQPSVGCSIKWKPESAHRRPDVG